MVLLIGCKPEIEYRDVIKEVPIEVIIEVPAVDESRINELISRLNLLQQKHEADLSELEELFNANLLELNNANLDKDLLSKKIEELKLAHQKEISKLNDSFDMEKKALQNQLDYEANYQLNELLKYYNNKLLQLDEAYNAKVEELLQANITNDGLLKRIGELNEFHQSEIEQLEAIYKGRVSELEKLICSSKDYKGGVYEFCVYRVHNGLMGDGINNVVDARNYYMGGLMRSVQYEPIGIFIYPKFDHGLERELKESVYVSDDIDVDVVRNDLYWDKIAYGYSVKDEYTYIWFLVWLFYQ